MSPRTLSRRFREAVGTTPGAFVAAARVRRAQELLERSRLSIERVAEQVGFRSSTVFRARFAQVVGTTPRAWRRAFGADNAPEAHGRYSAPP